MITADDPMDTVASWDNRLFKAGTCSIALIAGGTARSPDPTQPGGRREPVVRSASHETAMGRLLPDTGVRGTAGGAARRHDARRLRALRRRRQVLLRTVASTGWLRARSSMRARSRQ